MKKSFRKSHGTQHLIVTMLEKWKKAVDNGECASSLFLDLSKASEHSCTFICKIEGIRIFTKCTNTNA